MTNPSEVVADLRIAAEDARRFSAALFDRGYVRREGVRPFSELLERAADTIDRLTSTGEAVAVGWRWPHTNGGWNYWWGPTPPPYADKLEVKPQPLYTHASPREGHVEVPVGVNTDAEWELEQRAFDAANHSDVPEWAQKTVADLWRQYCLATEADQGETKP